VQGRERKFSTDDDTSTLKKRRVNENIYRHDENDDSAGVDVTDS